MPFFPDPIFGWAFALTLLALLLAASFVALRFMKIPNGIPLTAIALGIAFNIGRLALLAANEQKTWLIQTSNLWLGGVDGLLFSLAGFLLAFALYTVIWILGACGGGDVKL